MKKTIYTRLRDLITREQPVALATVVAGDDIGAQVLIQPDHAAVSMLTDTALVALVQQDALAMLLRGDQGIQPYGARQIFIETYPPPATIIMVGAVHIAVALTTFAKPLGFRTIVVDARGAFATNERFGHADE